MQNRAVQMQLPRPRSLLIHKVTAQLGGCWFLTPRAYKTERLNANNVLLLKKTQTTKHTRWNARLDFTQGFFSHLCLLPLVGGRKVSGRQRQEPQQQGSGVGYKGLTEAQAFVTLSSLACRNRDLGQGWLPQCSHALLRGGWSLEQ